jgi:hypothetical protein
VGAACLGSTTWLITYLGYQAVAPRVAYLALSLCVFLLALAASQLPSRAAVATVLVLVTASNAWTIVEVGQLNAPKFISWWVG